MKIKALSSEERKYVVSVGGSMLLTEHIHTDGYHQNEHQEIMPSIVQDKCFSVILNSFSVSMND
jgi:hypothetical protein